MGYMLLGTVALAILVVANLAGMAMMRAAVARAFGIPLPFYHLGRETVHLPEGASRWVRPAISLAGAAASYLVAASLFFAAFLIDGEPATTFGTRIIVLPDRPAAAAGMETGDKMVEIAGTKVGDFSAITFAIRSHPGEPIDIALERQGHLLHITVTPTNEGKIGVAPVRERVSLSVGQSLLRGVASPARTLTTIAQGALAILTTPSREDLGGPKRMVAETAQATQRGPGDALTFMGMLNAYFWPGFVILSFVLPPRRKKRLPPQPTHRE